MNVENEFSTCKDENGLASIHMLHDVTVTVGLVRWLHIGYRQASLKLKLVLDPLHG